MAVRQFTVPELGEINVYKRRKSKHIRISVDAHNKIKISVPYWLPYQHGVKFAIQKTEWILSKKHHIPILDNGDKIGKFHRLTVTRGTGMRIITKVSDSEVIVFLPTSLETNSLSTQTAIRRACIRALKQEAESLLPQRLETLSTRYDYNYKSLTIKHLKSRWGSCNNVKDITLNCLLMQLTWAEIDYVIMHELAHTKHMAHNTDFWTEVLRTTPNYKEVKSHLSKQKPIVFGG